MPFTSKKLIGMLNIDPQNWNKAGDLKNIPDNHSISQPSLLFSNIDDEIIERQQLHCLGSLSCPLWDSWAECTDVPCGTPGHKKHNRPGSDETMIDANASGVDLAG